MLDDKDPRTSRIVFQDNKSEDQGLPAPGTSIPGIVDGTGHRNDPTSECFWSLPLRQIPTPLPSEKNADTGEEKSEPAATSGGTCQYRCVICFLLTSTSSGARRQKRCAWRFLSSRQCHREARRWIRHSQNRPRDNLHCLH